MCKIGCFPEPSSNKPSYNLDTKKFDDFDLYNFSKDIALLK